MQPEKGRGEGEPDFCTIVVKTAGKPGSRWGDTEAWAREMQKAHRFWGYRRKLDNTEFQERCGSLPQFQG